jgi:putative ABC transport system permease protein
MGIWANILEALRNLLATKQRSVLALIGIIIGTGSVVAMISIGGMVQNETLKRFEDMGTDLISIRLRAPQSGQGLGLEDLARVTQGLAPWFAVVTPSIENSIWVELGGKEEFFSQLGSTANMQVLYGLELAAGRFISPFDRYQRYAVVGQDVANAYAANGQALAPGSTLELDGQIYTVIGLLERAPVDLFGGNDVNRALIIPISTLSRLSGGEVGSFAARIKPGLSHQASFAEAGTWFGRNFTGIGTDFRSPERMIEQMQQQMRLLTLMLGAIGSISLVVGGVGVMNIMLVSVTERRREIGVRLAIGARRRDVRRQFLIEAVILALVGGLLGLVLGALAAWVVAYFANWGFFVTPPVLLLGFGVSAAIGVFFGFYPAVQASKVDPIVALRS